MPAVPKPATINELKAACPEGSAEFIVEQLEKGATVAQALSAYAAGLAAENSVLQQKLNANPGTKVKGTDPLQDVDGGGSGAFVGNAKEEWDQELSALLKDGYSRPNAVTLLNKKRPELREALVAEANSGRS